MAPKLNLEARMAIRELLRRGWSRVGIARVLGVCEGTIRYHERRAREGRGDGRRGHQVPLAAGVAAAIRVWWESRSGRLNLAELHDHLVAEHGYEGSLRSVQRFVASRYPRPAIRARRRVETPPGAQAQADWSVFGGVWVGGQVRDLLGFHLKLSWSRYGVLVWSLRKDQVAWQQVHLGALARLGGVPATIRVDNEKTAVSRGAGAWGEIHPSYRRFAERLRFHVDACAPRSPQAKGKVERWIGDCRGWLSPADQRWQDLGELQSWTDARLLAQAQRRRCPVTGGTVWEAYQQERPWLGELEPMARPFDVVVMRSVADDAMVCFEGRTYSVPFWLIRRQVEVFGCSGEVEIWSGGRRVAVHRRGTAERILIDPAHYEGETTEGVVPPVPLGRMGRRLQEIAALAPERRPLDLYAELAEVAR